MAHRYSSLLSFRLGSAVLAVFSLICTQIPLFDYLGFEFSALTSPLVSFVSGLVTISIFRKWQISEGIDSRRLLEDSTQSSLLLLLIPFSIISLNALIVKNCAFAEGAIFFLLINLPAVLLTNSIASLFCMASRRFVRTLFTIVFLALLSQIVIVTFTGPQIFAFNQVMGFFPGFTYDESLSVLPRLLLYRGETILLVALLWVVTEAVGEKRKRPDSTWREIVSSWREWTATAVVVLLAAFTWFSDDLSLSSSSAHVQHELGGQTETDHFVLSYPAGLKHSRVEDLKSLHEFYFDRISRELRVNPTRKIHVYIYKSAAQKGRLVGAGRTNISKPWLWQLHINLDDVESSLKHELVHVMAAEFGFPLLRIGPNSGLIEGLAVAVERVSYDAPIHLTAAEVFAVGVHPNMEGIFSISGFFNVHPGVSYTVAGSFCRYLMDQFGLRRFKRVYRSGDFQSVYGKSLEGLITEWRRYLEKFSIKESQKQRAEYLFKRPSIFGKECARTVANMNAETRSQYSRKDYAGALASANRSLERSANVEAIFQKVNSLFRLHQYTEAIDFAEAKLKDSTFAHDLLPLFAVLGDAYWASGDKNRAIDAYQLLLSTHLSLAVDEACAVRLETMFHPKTSAELKTYFIDDMTDSARVDFLRSKTAKEAAGITRYLLGRELGAKENYHDAIEVLSGKWALGLPELEFVRQQRMGKMLFRLGEYQKAKIHFWESLNFISNEAYFSETDEWLKRCDWMQEHSIKPNL